MQSISLYTDSKFYRSAQFVPALAHSALEMTCTLLLDEPDTDIPSYLDFNYLGYGWSVFVIGYSIDRFVYCDVLGKEELHDFPK